MQSFPEEYSDGYVIFMGERFTVDPRALIPRLETEELVKYALRILQEHPEIRTVADIGTGCGIIPISIAANVGRNIQLLATDMSQEALELARENLIQVQSTKYKVQNEKNPQSCDIKYLSHDSSFKKELRSQYPLFKGGRRVSESHSERGTKQGDFALTINFLQGDLLQPIISYFGNSTPDSILITANLPYVREKEINSGLIHEPRMAFLGGAITGFELYEKFFREFLAWQHRPRECHVVIEFGLWQRDIAETLFQQLNLQYSFFEDLRGIERFAHLQVKS